MLKHLFGNYFFSQRDPQTPGSLLLATETGDILIPYSGGLKFVELAEAADEELAEELAHEWEGQK